MILKSPFSAQNWHLRPKNNLKTPPPGPIFDHPVNPVPHYIASASGDKVEALETTEKTVQLLLRKKHLYLTKVKSTYKLRKIIFHTQLVHDYNLKKGYPENRNLGTRPLKTSTILPGREAEAAEDNYYPPVIKPHTTVPRTFPRNFFEGVPRPIKYPSFHPEETDCSGENPIPEYIIVPFPITVDLGPVGEEQDQGTDFLQIDPEELIKYSSFFEWKEEECDYFSV